MSMSTKTWAILSNLPIYGDYECYEPSCTRPAVIRHPASGRFYCAGDARHLAESHEAHMTDIVAAVQIRQRMLKEQWECAYCDKPAERSCAFCRELICFKHMQFIPRTGAACPDCGAAMESEAAHE